VRLPATYIQDAFVPENLRADRPLGQLLARLRGINPRQTLLFLVVFCGAKAAALFGVLWLARVAEPTLYAAVELGLAVGLIVCGVGMLGVPGAATRLALVGGEERVGDYLVFSAASVAVPACIVGLVTALALGWNSPWPLLALCCALSAVQTAGSSYARIRARPMLNSALDPFATLALLGICLGLWLSGSLGATELGLATAVASVLLTVALVVAFLRVRRDGFASAHMRVIRLGLPILALGGVAMIVSTGLRPLLVVRFDLEALAVYALCFRLCAPALLIYQILNTGFFARLYQASDVTLDRIVLGLTAVNGAVVFGLWLILIPLLENLFPQYLPEQASFRQLFPVVGVQVMLWLIAGLLEMKMGRHEIAGRAAVAGYVAFGAFGAAFLIFPLPELRHAVALFSVALLIFVLAQCALAWRRGIRLPLTVVAAVGAFIVFGGLALLG
jgi:hypothetical protein